MSTFIRALILYVHAHRAWPEYGAATLYSAVAEAVAAETADAPAEFLVAVAQHESDFEPTAVSWREGRRRIDLLWGSRTSPPDRPLTCGYLQAMATGRDDCAAVIADHGGMSRGAAELAEWSRACAGDLGCVARGHAGGTACARSRAACSADARTISDHFVRATQVLR